ncbi:hypothetical protein Hanom_Chr14g01284261 [Helianthus anomalus]
MELTSRMKMARTSWIQMRKNKPLDESHKTDQTSWTKIVFYSKLFFELNTMVDIQVNNRFDKHNPNWRVDKFIYKNIFIFVFKKNKFVVE